jgi:hypothetical protein
MKLGRTSRLSRGQPSIWFRSLSRAKIKDREVVKPVVVVVQRVRWLSNSELQQSESGERLVKTSLRATTAKGEPWPL